VKYKIKNMVFVAYLPVENPIVVDVDFCFVTEFLQKISFVSMLYQINFVTLPL